MGLFILLILILLFVSFGKKKQKPSTTRKKGAKTNASGERMDCLTRKGDLPYGWSYANRNFTEKIEKEYSQFTDAYYKSKKRGMLKEYAALKSLIVYVEDVRKLCKRKGECFEYWASCIVARPQDIAEYKARLKILEAKLKTAKK